ncbi:CYTH domain protein [Roseimaritima multifibrata]|uniref:CYTH domain protein n=1 Tax=Roseimaritima multifibrata TaxID=1930274 RepID=A0A517M8U7_9BACT|nr:class IV adenylate cyclase [Roseimaritima multifibrata]QDS91318.1 CYTH domain protein [Roseimaritima multifibrata]
MYEIELKYRISDPDTFRKKIVALGAADDVPWEDHADTYFAHPCKNFAETTEALRIRRIDGHSRVTYKGPKQGGPVKVRQELEWLLEGEDKDGSNLFTLFVALGFQPVTTVQKRRQSLAITWDEHAVCVTIDQIPEVGSYSELEVLASCDAEVPAAKAALQRLAEQLGLTQPEPRSYLALQLARQEEGQNPADGLENQSNV